MYVIQRLIDGKIISQPIDEANGERSVLILKLDKNITNLRIEELWIYCWDQPNK